MTMIASPVRCEDEGFFGPESVIQRVTGPTMHPALIYAAAMFALNPWDATITKAHTTGLTNPMRRAALTLEYTFAVTFGDRSTAQHAAEIVNRIHDTVTGTWGPTGDRVHSASEPENLKWFLTAYSQGLLEAYDAYGPKRLTREERDRYWRDEISVIADLNRIPLDMMFSSQADVDAYLVSQIPNLLVSEALAPIANAVRKPPLRTAMASGLVLLPDYAMTLLGIRPYSRVEKLMITAGYRPVLSALALTPGVRDLVAGAVTSRQSMRLMRRVRQAHRTGEYDPPLSSEPGLRLAASA